MTAILGISAFYHDSAAALVVDGEIVAAAQEERFSRIKHDAGFPNHAIEYCLAEAGLRAGDLGYVAFYEKPLVKFDRILETFVSYAPRGFGSFRQAIPAYLKDKLNVRRRIRQELRELGSGLNSPLTRATPILFLEHHESHAASAFFPSPFDQAAILTLDGVGEWSTTTLGMGRGNAINVTHHLQFPHSLGLLYSAFTAYCGFEVNDGEYKLMGLAPYGQPVYADVIRERLIDLKADGSFRLNMDYFSFAYARRMMNPRFDELLGGPPWQPNERLQQRHADLAASIQAVLNEAVLRIGTELHRRTGQRNLVMAGGVALNCVANERLLREGPFEQVWIQPAAGDAGGALGAALFVWHQLLGKPRAAQPVDSQRGSLLGPRFSTAEVRAALERHELRYEELPGQSELNARVAHALAEGKVVGWFRGRMEFGPRALGARSILADARRPEMQAVLNQKIKFREGFRPFAPSILAEAALSWFDLPKHPDRPYMLFTAPVLPARRTESHAAEAEALKNDPDFCRRAAVVRSAIPSVTHVDYSARVQTVDAERNPEFHALLVEFQRLTGCPVLINTSFNVRGEPIVCAPQDAIRCFEATYLDVLVLENFVVEKLPEDARIFREQADHRSTMGEQPPSTRQLREFAVIGAVFLVILGMWQLAARPAFMLATTYAAAGVLLMWIGSLRPRWLAPIFSAWMTLVSPLAWLTSAALMAIVFYGLITPLALIFRLRGREALDLAFGSDQDSYWREKPAAKDARQYRKQF
jgi:carbamoyltransferase